MKITFFQAKYVKMLLYSVILYFCTQIFDIVFTLIVLLSNYPSCTLNIGENTLAMWQPIIRMVSLLNYSINFILYVFLAYDRDIRSFWKRKLSAHPPVVGGELGMEPLLTDRKMVRFADRTEPGKTINLPQMKREKSSVLLPQVVGSVMNTEMVGHVGLCGFMIHHDFIRTLFLLILESKRLISVC